IDWRYAAALDPGSLGGDSSGHPTQRVDLIFDGIDTVATVRLRNGNEAIEIGRTFNMHRSYRFDITPHLRDRSISLEVDLHSATAFATAEQRRLGDRPRAYPPPYNFIRKMACSFGWDWGPDLRTAGLWKPVRLERWSIARLAQVRPLLTVDDTGTGHAQLHVEFERLGTETPLTLRADVLDHAVEVTVAAGATSAVVDLEVPDVPLWWPVGYGEQPLADLTLVLSAPDRELDRWQRRVGFRTVTLDTGADEIGSKFTLAVNGRPVFAKGVNWIPDDHFLTRITAEQLEHRLDQAVQAHVNLVRVWGGGIYESEDFYSACNERGLLVWQDFSWPVPPTRRSRRSGRRSRPRRGRTWSDSPPTRRWCCTAVATRTCGGTRAGAGRSAWPAGPGVFGTRTSCSLASSPSSIPPVPTARTAPARPDSTSVRSTPTTQTTGAITSGRSGTRSTTRPTAVRSLGSAPSSGSRPRRPGGR
ncbi:MAG TPA: hypothetical protein VGW74_17975, partial [Propionibacteriaceae bacterium]|nr:hypothetical protein [Propionibacteriaceae bacterium]